MSMRTFFRKIAVRFRCRRLGLEFPLFCKVHGVKAPDFQGALAQSRAGDGLQLVHVPLETRPENVYVYSIELNRILGRLESGLSEKLVRAFGKGFCLDGRIENITGGPPSWKYFGCNLRILDTMTLMEPYLTEQTSPPDV